MDGWDVVAALSRIPGRHREILTMSYYEGLSQREISNVQASPGNGEEPYDRRPQTSSARHGRSADPGDPE